MNDVEKLEEKVEWILSEMQKVDKRLNTSNESVTAYIQLLEGALNDLETKMNERIVRGDDAMHDLVTRTSNSLYAEIKKLERRVSDCELAVGTKKTADVHAPNDFEMEWHPYKVGDAHPNGIEQVVVMLKNGLVSEPAKAMYWEWDKISKHTIVAWRRTWFGDIK